MNYAPTSQLIRNGMEAKAYLGIWNRIPPWGLYLKKTKKNKHNSKAGLEALHVQKNISVEICFKMLILG